MNTLSKQSDRELELERTFSLALHLCNRLIEVFVLGNQWGQLAEAPKPRAAYLESNDGVFKVVVICSAIYGSNEAVISLMQQKKQIADMQ